MALVCCEVKLGNPGMRPLPLRMVETICAKLSRAPMPISEANAALADVEGARARFVSAGRESAGPGNVIRIDVNDRGAGVNRRAAPLRASIESREDNGFRANRERNELTITVKFFEIVE